uniref:Double-headed protease inhibitor, submandibular gland n=1 Tax=Suricata suricatta TaxID=37032 RepID=A0A673V7P6_SURSU
MRTSFQLQAFCTNYEKPATRGKPCPKVHKPVCGSDGQTYRNGCEFCQAAKKKNGKLGFKHNGKC